MDSSQNVKNPRRTKPIADRRKADRSADAYQFITTEEPCLADLWPEIPSYEALAPIQSPIGSIPDDMVKPVIGRRIFPKTPNLKNSVPHSELTRLIAENTGLNHSVVIQVLITMCQVVCEMLLQKKAVQLFGLGTLIPYDLHQKRFKERTEEYVKIGFVRRLWVFFNPSFALMKDMIQTFGMRNVTGWDWVVPRRKKIQKRLDSFSFLAKAFPEDENGNTQPQ